MFIASPGLQMSCLVHTSQLTPTQPAGIRNRICVGRAPLRRPSCQACFGEVVLGLFVCSWYEISPIKSQPSETFGSI